MLAYRGGAQTRFQLAAVKSDGTAAAVDVVDGWVVDAEEHRTSKRTHTQ